jgi:hypothetical protein
VRPLVEGVPDWLYPSLQAWLYRALQNVSAAVITLRPSHGLTKDTQKIMLHVQCTEQPWSLTADDPRFLDAIDAAVRWLDWPDDDVQEYNLGGPAFPHDRAVTLDDLETALGAANSAWRVSKQFHGLERRVDPTVTQAVQVAANVDATAGDHLAVAWEAAYGRHPDPDKAYDEAVLAVESLACPLVCPTNKQRTLGTAIRDLRNQATTWELALGDTTTTNASMTVDVVLSMMEALWHGQSRHAGSPNSRRQTQVEGESAVHLAATLVQWLGNGVLRRK